jgi:Amt family ammonium transporter
MAQAVGSAIVTVSTFVVALTVMFVVNAIGQLRVSREGEVYGLDLHEHGISAYPEYVVTAAGRPSGLPEGLAAPSAAGAKAH